LPVTSCRLIESLELDDIRADAVLEFLHHVESSRRNTPATGYCRLAAIRSFVDHLLRHDLSRAVAWRSRASPIADAMYVAPTSFDRVGFASAALVMWRPCVAYLLIVSAIALPALAALTAG